MLSRRLFFIGLPVFSWYFSRFAQAQTQTQTQTQTGDFQGRINPDTVLGNPNSKVLVEEFVSATCPHCRRFHEQVFPEIKKQYIDTNRIAWQLQMFPLDRDSLTATKLMECAPAKNFNQIVEVFLKNQKLWSGRGDDAIIDFAVQIGFSEERARSCVNDKEIESLVIRRIVSAQNLYGINSTPSFVLNGELQTGGGSRTNLKLILERALRQV